MNNGQLTYDLELFIAVLIYDGELLCDKNVIQYLEDQMGRCAR